MKLKHTLHAAASAVLITVVVAHAFGREDSHDHAAKPLPAPETAHGADQHEGTKHAEAPHADEVTLTSAAIVQNHVKVMPVELRQLTATIVAPSRVAFNAEAMAHIGSIVSGRVVEIKVRVGDEVKKYDVLFVVESPELGRAQSDFLQRRTESDVADAAIVPTRDAYTRAKQIFDESQGVAFSEVQKRDVEQRKAIGDAASAKASLQAAENHLRLFGVSETDVKRLIETGAINPRHEILAPLAGQVIEREVTLGELVSLEKEKLMVLCDTSTLWALAEIPEARLTEIGLGSRVELQLASLPGERIVGAVSLIAPEIDPNTRAAQLRIVIDNDHGKLRPGMFGRALIHSIRTDAASMLAIPEEAVQITEGKPSVFVPVADEENTFARREITVGKSTNGYVPVIAGLEAGENIVVSGSFILKAELGKSEAGHEH